MLFILQVHHLSFNLQAKQASHQLPHRARAAVWAELSCSIGSFLTTSSFPHMPASSYPTVILLHQPSCQNTFNLKSRPAKLTFCLHQESKPSPLPIFTGSLWKGWQEQALTSSSEEFPILFLNSLNKDHRK